MTDPSALPPSAWGLAVVAALMAVCATLATVLAALDDRADARRRGRPAAEDDPIPPHDA
jgi:hypothetical protein